MWNTLRYCRAAKQLIGYNQQLKRNFMSPKFTCSESWGRRLNKGVLQKVKLGDMYFELDSKFNQNINVTAVDLDIFTNAVNDESFLDEMDDLVHRFRLSSEAANILPSTHHALIRAFHSFGEPDELIRILDDRLNYGIFPDDYCNLLLIDSYIVKGDFLRAAKVATMYMLQEDFSNTLLGNLSLYSCHKYLLNPEEWSPEDREAAEKHSDDDSDEEETLVRVKYLRNEYFDNHFDLRDSNKLIGKTFMLVGESLGGDIGKSYELLGSIMFSKYERASKIIDEYFLQGKGRAYSENIRLAEETLKEDTRQEKETPPTPDPKSEIISKIDKLKSGDAVVNEDVLGVIEENINSLVKNSEEKITSEQEGIYDKWDDLREDLLRKELQELEKLARLEEVTKKKQELKEKEELLFFFENEEKLDLTIENKRVIYPKKWHGKKKKKISQSAEYIPPEV